MRLMKNSKTQLILRVKLKLVIYLFFTSFILNAKSNINQYEFDSSFISFPFDDYLNEVGIKQIKQIEADRKHLFAKGFDGDLFIEKLVDYYLKNNTPQVNAIDSLTELLFIGEHYFMASYILNDSLSIYQTLGDRLLTTFSQQVQNGLEDKTLKYNTDYFKYWQTTLSKYEFHLNKKLTNFKKGLLHILNGNTKYVLKRVWLDYKYILIILIFLIVFFIIMKKYKKG